jgi:predicted metal-dependent HD superfamily phosphohydrolase
LAAWFHDAVYDTRRADNEERSAAFARKALSAVGAPGPVVDEVVRLVLLTRMHQAGPDDPEGQVLLDADLAVLAAEEDVYDRYAAAIRREYAGVADEDYRDGRRRVLEGLLRRPRIYATEMMFTCSEAAARRNLGREGRLLGAGHVAQIVPPE